MRYAITSISSDRDDNINKIKSVLGDGYCDVRKFNSGLKSDIIDFEKLYPEFNLKKYLSEPIYVTQGHRKLGEIGCWMSNFHIWNYVVENDIDFFVAVEDDCYFPDGIKEAINNFGGDKDLFLYGEWAELYSISNAGARYLVENAFEKGFKKMPMDEYLFISNNSEHLSYGRLVLTRQLTEKYSSNIVNSGYNLLQY